MTNDYNIDDAIHDLTVIKDFFEGRSGATPICIEFAIDALGKSKVDPAIVRCKDCKHSPWIIDKTDFTCVWIDDFADREQTPDDFCSYGERRE